MALSYDVIGWFAVCDCGISSFTIFAIISIGKRETGGCFTLLNKISILDGLVCSVIVVFPEHTQLLLC